MCWWACNWPWLSLTESDQVESSSDWQTRSSWASSVSQTWGHRPTYSLHSAWSCYSLTAWTASCPRDCLSILTRDRGRWLCYPSAQSWLRISFWSAFRFSSASGMSRHCHHQLRLWLNASMSHQSAMRLAHRLDVIWSLRTVVLIAGQSQMLVAESQCWGFLQFLAASSPRSCLCSKSLHRLLGLRGSLWLLGSAGLMI